MFLVSFAVEGLRLTFWEVYGQLAWCFVVSSVVIVHSFTEFLRKFKMK